MTISIREAVRDDADAIAATHIAAWRAGYAHIFPTSVFDDPDFDRSRRAMWRTWAHSPTPDRRLVVATTDRRVVGFAHTGDTGPPEPGEPEKCGELFGFYTHPETWGTGVATQLMDAAVEHLTSLELEWAVVWTLDEAGRARSFYEKAGWEATGRDDIWGMYPEHPVTCVEYQRALR